MHLPSRASAAVAAPRWWFAPQRQAGCSTLRFGRNTKVLAKRMLQYSRILQRAGAFRNSLSVMQVVDRALRQLQQNHNPAGEPAVLGVVRLSGLIHADERTAFREAARQMCKYVPG